MYYTESCDFRETEIKILHAYLHEDYYKEIELPIVPRNSIWPAVLVQVK